MSPAVPQRDLAAAQPATAPVRETGHSGGEKQPRQLRLVERKRRRPVYLRRLGVALLMGFAALLCLGLVALHALIAEDQFTLNRLQDQAASAQAAYDKLRLKVAVAEAPARIVSVAEGKLHMVQPASVTYIAAPKVDPQAPPRPGRKAERSQAGTTTVPAPEGDANWPAVKPYLSANP
jgi:hypothetical protein